VAEAAPAAFIRLGTEVVSLLLGLSEQNVTVPLGEARTYYGCDSPVTLGFDVPPSSGVAGWNLLLDVLASENGPVLFSLIPALTDATAGSWQATASKTQQTLVGGPGRYFYRVRRTDPGMYWALGNGTWLVLP
jgi:hypothetical protein